MKKIEFTQAIYNFLENSMWILWGWKTQIAELWFED